MGSISLPEGIFRRVRAIEGSLGELLLEMGLLELDTVRPSFLKREIDYWGTRMKDQTHFCLLDHSSGYCWVPLMVLANLRDYVDRCAGEEHYVDHRLVGG